MNTLTRVHGQRRLLNNTPFVITVTDIDEDGCVAFAKDFSAAVASGQPIIPIVIQSTGGDLFDAFKMIAQLKTSPVPVATICAGHAYSAAALLLSSGTDGYRYVSEYATVMLHQASMVGITGTAREVTNEAKELERANTQAFKLLASNTGQAHDFFSDIVKKADGDVYLDATTTVQYNIANHVGMPHLEVAIDITLSLSVNEWQQRGNVLELTLNTINNKKRKRDDDSDDDDD